MTRLSPHPQLQLMVVTLVTPLIAVAAWSVGLHLAGGILALVWVAAGGLYVYESVTRQRRLQERPCRPAGVPSVDRSADGGRSSTGASGGAGERVDRTGVMIDMPSRFAANVPPGSILAQGDHASIDARTVITHNTSVNVSLEDRARILAEVGQALRPVLEGLNDRIAHLERDNRALRDTIDALAFSRPQLCTGPGAREEVSGALPFTPRAELSSLDVGAVIPQTDDADPSSPDTRTRAPLGQQTLLEELRHGC